MRHRDNVDQTDAGRRQSRPLLRACFALLFLCLGLQVRGQGVTLSFSDLANAVVNFSGGGFTFTDAPGTSNQFKITSVMNGTGSSVGLDGNILPGGPFMIGSITSFTEPFLGLVQTASVTGSGTLYITDLNSLNLTGTIQWDTVTTVQTAGSLDLSGTINLTAITYSGTNPDLIALAAGGAASDVVTFQFDPAESLSQLQAETGPGLSTSYSGTITAVPEPGVLSLVGVGLGLLGYARRRNK